MLLPVQTRCECNIFCIVRCTTNFVDVCSIIIKVATFGQADGPPLPERKEQAERQRSSSSHSNISQTLPRGKENILPENSSASAVGTKQVSATENIFYNCNFYN